MKIRFAPLGFGRRVCLILQPGSTDRRQDPPRARPRFGLHRRHGLPQLLDGFSDPVADPVLDQIPELLAGIGLGTAGGKVDDADVGRQVRVSVAKLEAGLLADEPVDGTRIARREVLKINANHSPSTSPAHRIGSPTVASPLRGWCSSMGRPSPSRPGDGSGVVPSGVKMSGGWHRPIDGRARRGEFRPAPKATRNRERCGFPGLAPVPVEAFRRSFHFPI